MKVSHLPANMEERCILNIALLVTRLRGTESKAEAKTQDRSTQKKSEIYTQNHKYKYSQQDYYSGPNQRQPNCYRL